MSTMRVHLFLIAGLFALGGSSSLAQNTTHLQSGVVQITAATEEGKHKTGTGFIVKLGPDAVYIVTAAHVVRGDKHPEVEFFTRRNISTPATVIFLEPEDSNGLAVLAVKERANVPGGLSALSLASNVELGPGDEVATVGFPAKGGSFALIKGSVVGKHGRDILFSAPIDEGNSGGPLVKGSRVVGLVTAKDVYSHAVPAESLKLFLAGLGIRGVATLDGTKIAYSSDRGGAHQIYIMNPDGSDEVQVTRFQGHNYHPAWSADGTKIAFASKRDGNWDIFVIGVDGANPQNLTAHPAADDSPAWSPDGTKIAFVSERERGKQIYVMNADGTNVVALTRGRAYSYDPAWSPDGRKLAFTSEADGKRGIYLMDAADGGNVRRLSEPKVTEYSPVWSPDGTKIAYVCEPDDTHIQIFVMDADGTNPKRLGKLSTWAASPSWAPDGTKIVYEAGYQTHREIFVINADGTEPTRLTKREGLNSVPAWSPFPR